MGLFDRKKIKNETIVQQGAVAIVAESKEIDGISKYKYFLKNKEGVLEEIDKYFKAGDFLYVKFPAGNFVLFDKQGASFASGEKSEIKVYEDNKFVVSELIGVDENGQNVKKRVETIYSFDGKKLYGPCQSIGPGAGDKSVICEGKIAIQENDTKGYFLDSQFKRVDNKDYRQVYSFGAYVPGVCNADGRWMDHEGYCEARIGVNSTNAPYYDYHLGGQPAQPDSAFNYLISVAKENKLFYKDLAGNYFEMPGQDSSLEESSAFLDFAKRARALGEVIYDGKSLEDLDVDYFKNENFADAVTQYAMALPLCEYENVFSAAPSFKQTLKEMLNLEFVTLKDAKNDKSRILQRYFQKMTIEQTKAVVEKISSNLDVVEEKKKVIAAENDPIESV